MTSWARMLRGAATGTDIFTTKPEPDLYCARKRGEEERREGVTAE